MLWVYTKMLIPVLTSLRQCRVVLFIYLDIFWIETGHSKLVWRTFIQHWMKFGALLTSTPREIGTDSDAMH